MDSLQLKMCDIQGRLFELSAVAGYESASFIEAFMNSQVARYLDSRYNRLQWAGEEYLLEELIDEKTNVLKHGGGQYTKDELFWIGYLYRYWHFYTDDSSQKIYTLSPASTMKRNYLIFHTLDPEIAIDNLIEIFKQNQN